MFKKVLLGGVGIVFLIVLAFGLELGGLQWSKFFGVRRQHIKREIFKETRSYNEGKIQDLARYKLQYQSSSSTEQKAALVSIIRHMFADYDLEEMPKELRNFLKEIRGY